MSAMIRNAPGKAAEKALRRTTHLPPALREDIEDLVEAWWLLDYAIHTRDDGRKRAFYKLNQKLDNVIPALVERIPRARVLGDF